MYSYPTGESLDGLITHKFSIRPPERASACFAKRFSQAVT